MIERSKLTELQVRMKLESFCAYQERCHFDVTNKLIQLGVYGESQEQMIAYLIENNFLHEQRFAEAFVSGKLRIKRWGRNKIIQGLKAKRISERILNDAMKEIDGDEYFEILKKEVLRKSKYLEQEKDPYIKKMKLIQYLQARGFELDIIQDAIKEEKII